jgi:broad specificity phosphatase PhoE
MKPTVVYLVRHGATAANLEVPYRLLGRAIDIPLDATGNDQARRAAEALRGFDLAAVYSSPLLRARETAGWIARPHEVEPIVVPDLIEASLGRWEGLTWDQARAADPELYEAFHASPGVVPYPDGESFLDAQRRMVPAIDALASAHAGRRIAVVSHNVTNRAFLAALLCIPIDRARAIRQANGGINIIHYDDGRATVETVNARFHLDGSSG